MDLLWLCIDVIEIKIHPKESNSNLAFFFSLQAMISITSEKNWSQHFYIIIFLKQT